MTTMEIEHEDVAGYIKTQKQVTIKILSQPTYVSWEYSLFTLNHYKTYSFYRLLHNIFCSMPFCARGFSQIVHGLLHRLKVLIALFNKNPFNTNMLVPQHFTEQLHIHFSMAALTEGLKDAGLIFKLLQKV